MANFKVQDIEELCKENVTKIDYMFFETATVASMIAQDFLHGIMEDDSLDNELHEKIMKDMLAYRNRCRMDEDAPYKNPRRRISNDAFQALGLNIQDYPTKLSKQNAENYFLMSLISLYKNTYESFLKNLKLAEKVLEKLSLHLEFNLVEFMYNECILGCSYKCIQLHDTQGYCMLCAGSKEALPCPLKQEITTEELGISTSIIRCTREHLN